MGINLFYTNTLGDTITVVTRKAEQHQDEWVTTGDDRVRFPSSRAAVTTYEHERTQQHNKDTHADILLGHTRHVCPTLIPTWHNGETSQDDSLHKAFVACTNFRGKHSSNLLQMFRDSLHELYDRLYDLDAERINQPEDFYTTLSDETKVDRDSHNADLGALHIIYLFEFYKIVKIGGIDNLYACIEWPGLQIPQAIISLLEQKGLRFTFYNDKREAEDHTLHFYERNSTGRGLDFDDYPDDKTDLFRYAVEPRCLNPIVDTKKSPLSQLEDLAEEVEALMAVGLKTDKEPRRELEKLL